MSCFACFFRLLLLVALIKNQFGRYLLVQVEETKKIDTPQVIPQIEVDEEKKIDIPQVIPQVEVEEEKKIVIPQVIPQVEGDEEEKIDIPLPQTRDVLPFARFQDGPAACTKAVPTEWVKKFEFKTEPPIMLLKGGQKVRFFLDLELAKEIPEGSYLGVEAYALKPSNLGVVPCFPIAIPNPKTGEEVDFEIGSCNSPPYELEELLLQLEQVGVDCTIFGPNGCKLPIKPDTIEKELTWNLPKDFEKMEQYQIIKQLLEGKKTDFKFQARILNEDEEELACADAALAVDFP